MVGLQEKSNDCRRMSVLLLVSNGNTLKKLMLFRRKDIDLMQAIFVQEETAKQNKNTRVQENNDKMLHRDEFMYCVYDISTDLIFIIFELLILKDFSRKKSG